MRTLTRLLAGLAALVVIPNSVFACAPEEVRAFRSAHCVVAGEILSVARTSGSDLVTYTVKVKPTEVLYGDLNKDDALDVEMALWKPKEDPIYQSAKPYVLYLRKEKPHASAEAPARWSVKYGTTSIRPDTKKLREMLIPMIEGRMAANNKPPEKVDVDKLSPVDRKMYTIIIPEADFMCANIHDALSFFHHASIEYDRSQAPVNEKGVNIVLNTRTFPKENLWAINYYLEDESLLKNVELAAAIYGERHVMDDWVVISSKDSGQPRPAVSLGSQGTNSVLYRTLSSTIITEIDFRQATLGDVAEFLAQAAGARVLADKALDKSGDRITITLEANHVSVLSVLRILSVLCPIEVALDGKATTMRALPATLPADNGEKRRE